MDTYRVGQKIRILRIERGLTQEMLAEAADLSVSHLSCIERGRKNVGLEALIRVADALQVGVNCLLEKLDRDIDSIVVPEICELLRDCTTTEKHVILETSKAVKTAMRDNFEI